MGVEFQKDWIQSTQSFLKYKGTLPDLKKASLCLRYYSEIIRGLIPLFSYATDKFDNEFSLCQYKKDMTFE